MQFEGFLKTLYRNPKAVERMLLNECEVLK